MKGILLAVLLSVIATAAQAQGTATETCNNRFAEAIRQAVAARDTDALHRIYNDETSLAENAGATAEQLDAHFLGLGATCARIESSFTSINFADNTLAQVEADTAIAEQETANRDLVNGAQRLIQSGNRADVLAGLDTLQSYLARAESALGGKGLEACNTPGGSMVWNRRPCNPMPMIKGSIDRNFERLGWPVAASPSAAYAWLVSEYQDGPPDVQRQVQDFASSNVFEILPHAILAKVEQLDRAQLAAEVAQAPAQEIADVQAAPVPQAAPASTSSMADRFVSAVTNFVGFAIMWVLVSGLLMRLPLPIPTQWRVAPAQNTVYVLITLLPFYGLYVLIGGGIGNVSLPLKYVLPLEIALLVPGVMLTKRILRNRSWSFLSFGRRRPAADAGNGLHGSAHWTSTEQATQQGHYQPAGHVLADSHGFALGRPLDADNKAMKDLDARFRYMGHVLTIAPNGAGKGIGAVIPNLLDYPGSCVVLDVKGENYAATARFRAEQLGHAIYVVDPFGVTGKASSHLSRFNWLDRLDPDNPAVVEEASALADLLVVSEGRGSEASEHFNDTARNLIRGLMVHVATLPSEQRNMGEVRRLLTLGGDQFDAVLAQMMTNPRGFDLPARAANAFNDAPEKERGSILSTARRHLAFLDDPRLLDSLSATDFAFDDLKRRPMTIYLVMPPHSLHANRGYVRGFFGQALMSMLATGLQKPGDLRVLFLLDEFAQLGHMNIVAEKLSVMRGYGAAMWFILQNLGQLKETYPRWQDFFANCNAKQWFGTSDYDTARYISDSLGKRTVEFQTANTSRGDSFGMQGGSTNTGGGTSQQFIGRELMTPDEIMRLPPETAIVQVQGEAPHQLRRLNYLTDPEYAGLYDSAY